MADLERYVNRTVRYAFFGEELSFALSHALFSSYTVDQGTTLLLKTVAKRIDLPSISSVLDVGCGVGVIGICLARKAPHLKILMQDRDALALVFSKENGRRNGIANAEYSCALALWGLGERKFDLIASNWPAKAGPAVLADFCRRAPRYLTKDGVAAVVIVHTLAESMERLLRECGHRIQHAERTAEHAVFHFRAGPADASPAGGDEFAPYLRTRRSFRPYGVAYELATVYGLPDFDDVGFQTAALLDMLREETPSGNLLFWNPGQGHAPAFLLGRRGEVSGATLCSRDMLELEASRRNLESLGAMPPVCRAVPTESDLGNVAAVSRFDMLCALPHPVPGVRWQEDLLRSASRLLVPEGRLCVAGTSTEMGRFLDHLSGFRLKKQHRQRGFRAAMLHRTASGAD
jgi:SAM-dependent methyltransferase